MIHWKTDFFVGLAFLLVSVTAFATASTYPRMTAMFPEFVSIVLASLSAMLMISAFRKRNSNVPFKKIEHNLLVVVKIVSALIVYILTIKWLGYIVSTFMIISFTIVVLGYQKIRQLLVISGASVLILYLVFKYLINTPLPTMGLLELFDK